MSRNRCEWFRRENRWWSRPLPLLGGDCMADRMKPSLAWRHCVVVLAAFLLFVVFGSVAVAQERKSKVAPPVEKKRRASRGWEGVSSRGFLHAADAARQDAIERLAKRVETLRLSRTRLAVGFTKTSPAITDGLCEAYAGVTLSQPKYTLDQICTVRARVAVGHVIARLKVLNRKYGRGQFRDRDFDAIASLNDVGYLVAVGQGVPALSQLGWRRAAGAAEPPKWVSRKLNSTCVGKRSTATRRQARHKVMAVSSGRKLALRQLAADARKLKFIGPTRLTVGELLEDRLELAEAFDEWVRRSRTVKIEWSDTGDAIVEIEADLADLWEIVAPPRRLDRSRGAEGPRRKSVTKSRRGKSHSRP